MAWTRTTPARVANTNTTQRRWRRGIRGHAEKESTHQIAITPLPHALSLCRSGASLCADELPPRHIVVLAGGALTGSCKEIRRRIFHRLPYHDLVTPEVADYIDRFGLYLGRAASARHPRARRPFPSSSAATHHKPAHTLRQPMMGHQKVGSGGVIAHQREGPGGACGGRRVILL